MGKVLNLDINVMGKDFKVACPEEEREALLRAVDLLDQRMREIRDAGKVIGIDRIAVMAALNIAHEHLSAPRHENFDSSNLQSRIQSMQSAIESALTE